MITNTLFYRDAVYRLVANQDTDDYNDSMRLRSHSKRVEFRSAMAKQWQDVKDVIEFLKNLGIDPVVVGGLAVQHYGYERLTEDIDVLIDRESYDQLVNTGEVYQGRLTAFSDFDVDVLTEGEENENNPDPSVVRLRNTNLPTFEGLMYLKLNAGRLKDQSDIVELIKHKKFDPAVKKTVVTFLKRVNQDLILDFESLWNIAEAEGSKRH